MVQPDDDAHTTEHAEHAQHAAARSPSGATHTANRYPPPPRPPRLPPEAKEHMVRKTTAVDSAATASCKHDTTDMQSVQSGCTRLNMADDSQMVISLTGKAVIYGETEHGELRALSTGKTLVSSKLHNLLSPSAMFADPDSAVHSVHLEREGSALVLHDGARIPLRWDGRLFHLDYWSECEGAHAAQQADQAQASIGKLNKETADAMLALAFEETPQWRRQPHHEAHLMSACAQIGAHEDVMTFRELNRDAMSGVVMPSRVVEPPGMSHSGLEHRRHGHAHYGAINELRDAQDKPRLRMPPPGHRCAICEIANARRKNVSRAAGPKQPLESDGTTCACGVCRHNRSLPAVGQHEPGYELSLDLGGPMRAPSLDGAVYFAAFNARKSRLIAVDSMKRKSDTHLALERYCQQNGMPTVLHTDGGTEFLGKTSKFCRANNIRQTFTCPYASFENSHAESTVGYLKRSGRRILLESGLPDAFWFRAMHTGAAIHNQMVSPVNSLTTPLQAHFDDTRRAPELIVFGSVAYTLIVPKSARKSDLKHPAFAGIFVGYSDVSPAFMIYEPATGAVRPRRDVVFDEHWRWRPEHPVLSDLLIPTTYDGSSPIPTEWRYAPRVRTVKTESDTHELKSATPMQALESAPPSRTHDGTPSQGGLETVPPARTLRKRAAPAPDQGGPLPSATANHELEQAAPPMLLDQGGPTMQKHELVGQPAPDQGGLDAVIPAHKPDHRKLEHEQHDDLAGQPVSATRFRSARMPPVDDKAMPVPQVATALPIPKCAHGAKQDCTHGCQASSKSTPCMHGSKSDACQQCAQCPHGIQRMRCVQCSPPDVFDDVQAQSLPKPTSGGAKRTARKNRDTVDDPVDELLFDTGKAAKALKPNMAVVQRAKHINGKSYIELARDGYHYENNQQKMCKYGRADLKYDLQHGYLTLKKGMQSADLVQALTEARASVLTLDEYVQELAHSADVADSDAETVEADESTAPDWSEAVYERHIVVCSGTLSAAISILTKHKLARVLCVDIMDKDYVAKELCPPELQDRFEYVHLDVRELSYRTFQNLARDKLHVKVSQLSSVHFSPPCTTYSTAHHGKNHHRGKHMRPKTKLARDHDRLNESVLEVLKQVSHQSFRTVISVENPLSNWRHMPFVRRLLGSPGWFERTADHCMSRREGEEMFPRKRSTWLLFNVSTNVGIRKCDGTCGCVLDGTMFHKLLVCNRTDKMPGQTVIRTAEEQGRIPYGTWDILHEARLRSTASRTNPQKERPVPNAPQNEPLHDTSTARDPEIRARCEMVHGLTYHQARGLEYVGINGAPMKYSMKDLEHDMAKGFVSLRAEQVFSASVPLPNGKAKQRIVDQYMSDYFESACHIHTGSDPISEKDADSREDASEWSAAKWCEINGLLDLDCWTYRKKSEKHDDPIERKRKLYKGKFVFKEKSPANGQPGRKKARYVISDPKFLQKLSDVDCFSPMCRFETVRFLLSVAVERDWELISTDIKNAFPTSKLPEPVWMEIPKCIVEEKNEDGSLKNPDLKDCYAWVSGALYGLAHSPRCFSKHLDKWFRSKGYEPLDADSCLYVKYDEHGKVRAAAATFVDDALVAGDEQSIAEYRAMLKEDFTCSDLGMPSDFLGMQIERNRQAGTLKLFQTKYIEKMAERYGVKVPERKGAPTPLSYTLKLEPAEPDEERCDPTLMRSIAGALSFSSTCCRPDISQSVKEICKHLIDPAVRHYKAALQILTYLLATKEVGLTYTSTPVFSASGKLVQPGVLEGFSDASFAECMLTRRSTSGYVMMRCGAAVSWGARSQGKVAHSTSDSELRALAEASREVLWVRKLEYAFADPTVQNNTSSTSRQTFEREKPKATKLWEDNKACIKWVQNPCAHSRVKHIDVPLKSIREEIQEYENLDVDYIDTTRQLADVMTKNLSPKVHWRLVSRIMNVPNPLSNDSPPQ